MHAFLVRVGLDDDGADRCVHWIGLVIGMIGVLALLTMAARCELVVRSSIAIYSTALFAMLTCSALYHLTDDVRRKALYQRLDHAAIFFLIAGTYTPFTLTGVAGDTGMVLFWFVWTLAGSGMAFKLLWPRYLRGVSTLVYVLLGWSIVVVFDSLIAQLSADAVALLIAGGVLYSIGVMFHLWTNLPYQKAIWHSFVLLAAGCHYLAILQGIVPHIMA
jgi:hemolysin III